ncbi:unnamed protein product [Caenorhabditis bovis]|uniref:Uncharacterized protein n=1 Tax=Caenorhabditis bovis TaxID=2654633 RepID=A0A8S1DZP7_9PELO|nr:unnamed protein product [Caenorhabditis bovis]
MAESLLNDLQNSEDNPTIFSVFLKSATEKPSAIEVVTFIIVILISIIFNIFSLYIISKAKVFHLNLQFLIFFGNFVWFELGFSKILKFASKGIILLYISASTHYHCIYTIVFIPFICIIERSCATYFIFDYEKRKRRWVLITNLLLHNALSILFTSLTVTNYLRFLNAAIITSFIMVLSVCLFVYLKSYNERKLEYLDKYNQDIRFNLSSRYQLRENVKTFRMARKLFTFVVVIILIQTAIKTIPRVIEFEPNVNFGFRLIGDLMVHGGPIYKSFILLQVVDAYMKVCHNLLGIRHTRLLIPMKITFNENWELHLEDDPNGHNPTIISIFVSSARQLMSTTQTAVFIFIIILSSMFDIFCIIVVGKASVFHFNLQALLLWTAFAWFEFAAGKIIVIIYQQIYLDEKITDAGSNLLVWAAATHYHFMYFAILAPFCVFFERACATFFIFDYERKSRRWIVVTILSFQLSLSMIALYLPLCDNVRYLQTSIFLGALVTISLIGFIYLNRYNRNKLKYLERYHRDIRFTLASRYQLRENVKTFKLLKNLAFVCIFLCIGILIVKTVPMLLRVDEERKLAIRHYTDILTHSIPIGLFFAIIFAVDAYLRIVKQAFGIRNIDIRPVRGVEKKVIPTNAHFDQIKMLWK